MRSNRAFTLVEAIISVAIIVVLVAILTPVFAAAKRHAQITAAASKLHELWLGLEVYRSGYASSETFDLPTSYYSWGLPRWRHWTPSTFGVTDQFMETPCGYDPIIHVTNGFTQIPGWVSYTAPFYDPEILLTGNFTLLHYFATYRENSVMFIDPYCNPIGTRFGYPRTRKRGLAVSLDGRLWNRLKTGYGNDLRFYTDPPE